jgi:hypothetical protein
MKPRDLFLEVAKSHAQFVEEPAEQRERLTQAWLGLYNRAASVFDSFEAAGQIDSDEQVHGHADETEWFKTTKKVIEFAVPAPSELVNLIDPQHKEDEITVNVKIGCHDEAYSGDQGANWDELCRCTSLDILTTVITWKDDAGTEAIQRLERSNYMHSVLDDPFSAADVDDRIPENNYFHPADDMSRIEGFHGGLDLATQYLAQRGTI